MEGEALRKGKERVQTHLIRPMERAGMRRKAGVTVADHQEFLDRLAARLAYMDADKLDALAEIVEGLAGGKNRDIWPREITILNIAKRFQMPPPSESRLVRTYLQSAPGRGALERGCLVELFWWLRRHGQIGPPNEYGWSQIEQQADDNRGRRAGLARDAQRGTLSPSDAEWLKRYWATHERCVAIVNDTSKEEAAA